MFWVKYDDISALLAQQLVMTSSLNNVMSMTLDDYFKRGCYHGEIYNTLNMHNLAISQYCNDSTEIKQEQDKIEQQLKDFRTNLWNTKTVAEIKQDSINAANAAANDTIENKKTEKPAKKEKVKTNRSVIKSTKKEAPAKNKKGKPRRNATAEKRSLSIKCPVINVYHSEAREALFKKDARGKEQSYGTYDLRATDAKGTPLAYFSYENGEIMMRDAATGEKKSIGSGSYSGNAWVGPAILASYRELVAKVSPETKTSEASAGGEPEKKPGKKSGKKRKIKD
jgi:hypothetical protein